MSEPDAPSLLTAATADPTDATDRLAALVARRRELMMAILQQSILCEHAIEGGLVEKLLVHLEEKDHLVQELRGLQEGLAPHANVDPLSRTWRDAQTRSKCQNDIEETARLQAAILEIDERCTAAMIHRRDELFSQLHQTAGSFQVARAYATFAEGRSSTGTCIDLTSQ